MLPGSFGTGWLALPLWAGLGSPWTGHRLPPKAPTLKSLGSSEEEEQAGSRDAHGGFRATSPPTRGGPVVAAARASPLALPSAESPAHPT